MNSLGISKTKQRIRYIVTDLLSGAFAFWIFNIIRFFLLKEYNNGYTDVWAYIGSTKLIVEQCIVPPFMLGIYWLSGYYNQPYNKSRLKEFTSTLFCGIINMVIIYLVLLINDQTGKRIINYEIIIILFGLLFGITYFGRLLITEYAIQQFKKELWHINVVIIGNNSSARKMAKKLRSYNHNVKYHIIGFIDIPGEKNINDSENVLSMEWLKNPASKLKVNQIILAPQSRNDKIVMELLSQLFPLDIPIKISPDTFSFVTSAIRMNDIYAEPFIDLASPSISDGSKNIKRSFDVITSFLVLLLFSPIYAFLAICVKCSSKGPVFYKQERIGLHQKPFYIYKFRTMVNNAEVSGPQLSNPNDKRITKSGHWMRKYRLDELPQFWNVLKGDMSIVGPRPERAFYIKQIVKEAPYYVLVCQVRPGITSWGMVKYGYASSLKQMVERTRFDLIYLGNMSLSVDCKILIYTLKTVLGGKGV